MGVVAKAYTTTIVAGLVANASNVRRALDDVYSAVNGGIDSANLSATFKTAWWGASQISICNSLALFVGTTVEDALNEAAAMGGGGSSQVQDFTIINGLGECGTQYAGHSMTLAEPGTTASRVKALYRFQSASMTVDENAAFNLTVVGNVENTAGVMGTGADAYGVVFSASTAGYYNGTLFDDINDTASSIAIDCWFNLTSATRTNCAVLFHKSNMTACNVIEAGIDSAGSLYFHGEYNDSADTIYAGTPIASGVWNYGCFVWNSEVGMQLYLNGLLENSRSSATAVMVSGQQGEFYIGNVSGANLGFEGRMAYFRVRDDYMTQQKVDVGYATTYSIGSASAIGELILDAQVRPELVSGTGANSALQQQINWNDIEVCRNSDTLYRMGGVFNSGTHLRINRR